MQCLLISVIIKRRLTQTGCFNDLLISRVHFQSGGATADVMIHWLSRSLPQGLSLLEFSIIFPYLCERPPSRTFSLYSVPLPATPLGSWKSIKSRSFKAARPMKDINPASDKGPNGAPHLCVCSGEPARMYAPPRCLRYSTSNARKTVRA